MKRLIQAASDIFPVAIVLTVAHFLLSGCGAPQSPAAGTAKAPPQSADGSSRSESESQDEIKTKVSLEGLDKIKTPSSLIGSWEAQKCQKQDDDTNTLATLALKADGSFDLFTRYYKSEGDLDCAGDPEGELILSGEYALGAPERGSRATSYKMNWNFKKAKIKPLTKTGTAKINDEEFCGQTDWQIGVTRSLMDCEEIVEGLNKGATQYQLISELDMQTKEAIKLGAGEIDGGLTPEDRPTESGTFTYDRVK